MSDVINRKRWIFEQIDSWFFREIRPFNNVTGAELGSLFPPPARTLAGAVRGLVGERVQLDWPSYRRGNGTQHSLPTALDLCAEMGNPQQAEDQFEFGKLELMGPYLTKADKRLYPMPLHLLRDEQNTLYQLIPDNKSLLCDLGSIKLPTPVQLGTNTSPLADVKLKSMSDVWVTGEQLTAILAGKPPTTLPSPTSFQETGVYQADDLFKRESRIGIALESQQRATIDEAFYQVSHIRLQEAVAIEVEVSGIDECLQPATSELHHIRLGGEGRMATVHTQEIMTNDKQIIACPSLAAENGQFLLLLLTPLFFNVDNLFLVKPSEDEVVKLFDVSFKIISTVLGKSVREGGWNVAKNTPRMMHSLIPAGSVWFCQAINGDPSTLHGKKIGQETALGRGELAVGIW